MTETDISDGNFVLITTPPITSEHRAALHEYVERQLAAGRPVILEDGFSLEVRRLPPTVLASDHYARVTELLEASNQYQARYRKAEAALRERVRIRTGDHVYHRATEETWVVAYADYVSGMLSACGWPDGEAKIDECELTMAASEAEYRELLAKLTERRGDKARAIAFRDERP